MMNSQSASVKMNRLVQRGGTAAWKISRTLLLIGMEFMILYPFIYMFATAFRSPEDIMNPMVIWITRHWSLVHFKTIIKSFSYWNMLGFTLQIAIGAAALQTFICSLVGYGFARFHFRFKGALFALLIFTIIVPPSTYVTPLFLMFKFFKIPGVSQLLALFHVNLTFSLIDTPILYWVQALFGMSFRSGMFVFIYRQFFRGLPAELEDAASIDGSSAFHTFFTIMLPNAKSAMATVAIFSFVWHWNDYFECAILSMSKTTLSVNLSQMKQFLEAAMLSNGEGNYAVLQAQVQAGTLMAIIPLLIIFVVGQRFITSGIERSGLVG